VTGRRGAHRRKFGWLVVVGLVVAATCIRLGIWQLDRRSQRQARNAVASARLAVPVRDLSDVAWDSSLAFRRIRVSGTPDYARELILAPRSRDGSPGVHIITPIRVAGSDSAVLVDRGWVYSPDARTVNLSLVREIDTTFVGYIQEIPEPDEAYPPSGDTLTRTSRRLDRGVATAALPYPIFPFLVVATADSARTPGGIPLMRSPEPPLDGGPHMSYALQWFAFATVAVVGTAIAVRAARHPEAARTMHNPAGETSL
jgi:surfeit locus 1 family protein